MSTGEVKVKDCSFNCGKKIYWNVLQNAYYELHTQAKHICPNRTSAPSKPTAVVGGSGTYFKTEYKPKEEKLPMSNTFEMLYGSPKQVREQYQYLSDLITQAKGKVHGSQSHFIEMQLRMLIYFEVPTTYRENIQESFHQFMLRGGFNLF